MSLKWKWKWKWDVSSQERGEDVCGVGGRGVGVTMVTTASAARGSGRWSAGTVTHQSREGQTLSGPESKGVGLSGRKEIKFR